MLEEVKSVESVENTATITTTNNDTTSPGITMPPMDVSDKIALGVRLMVDQIVSVETTSQSYTIVAGMGLDWEASEEDIENEKKLGTSWRPKDKYSVNWLNNTNYEILGEEYSIRRGLNEFNNKMYVYYEVVFRGTFTNQFNCSSYPFDSQSLAFVCVGVGITLAKGYFVPVRCRPDIFTVNTTFLAINDWNFVNYDTDIVNIDWGLAKTGNKSNPNKNPELFYSTLAFVVSIKRKWYASLIRILLWMFLLSIMVFLISAIDPNAVEERLNYCIGILFAIIAFQFVISGHLPNLPYLTLIDKYNVFSLVLILITSIEAYIVGHYEPYGFIDGNKKTVDEIFYIFIFAIFIVFHVIFMYYVKKNLDKQSGSVEKYNISDTPLQLQSVLSFNKRNGLTDSDFGNKFE